MVEMCIRDRLLGVLMCFVAAVAIIFIIVRQLLYGGSAFGWPPMVCITMFLGGIQLLCIGILGSYLAKTYLEVKDRPIYITKESNTHKRKKAVSYTHLMAVNLIIRKKQRLAIIGAYVTTGM